MARNIRLAKVLSMDSGVGLLSSGVVRRGCCHRLHAVLASDTERQGPEPLSHPLMRMLTLHGRFRSTTAGRAGWGQTLSHPAFEPDASQPNRTFLGRFWSDWAGFPLNRTFSSHPGLTTDGMLRQPLRPQRAAAAALLAKRRLPHEVYGI